jgi:hypothetical protein
MNGIMASLFHANEYKESPNIPQYHPSAQQILRQQGKSQLFKNVFTQS